jgi:hypothetical protein
MDAFGCLLDDFGRHVATEVHFDDDFVSIQLVVTPHGRLAPLRGTAAARAIGEHRVAAIVEQRRALCCRRNLAELAEEYEVGEATISRALRIEAPPASRGSGLIARLGPRAAQSPLAPPLSCYVTRGGRAMKALTAILALLISSPAAAQECPTCSSADACIQTYLKATSQAQREIKQAIRDWKENLDKKASGECSTRVR